jgi:hypothetical protein
MIYNKTINMKGILITLFISILLLSPFGFNNMNHGTMGIQNNCIPGFLGDTICPSNSFDMALLHISVFQTFSQTLVGQMSIFFGFGIILLFFFIFLKKSLEFLDKNNLKLYLLRYKYKNISKKEKGVFYWLSLLKNSPPILVA